MKAFRFETIGDLSSLRQHEEDRPKPQRGEVLIRVRAVSLNYRDIALAEGGLLQPLRVGLVPTSDAAGDVVEIGEAVADFAVGDRVVAAFHPRWFGGPRLKSRFAGSYGYDRDGWLTELKVVSQEAILPLPDSLSFEEGATLPCAAVTAWSALTGDHPLGAGETVLTMGTGGVSLFAVQLAKAVGARVIATTSSKAKAERLKGLGADEVIDYAETTDWGDRVRDLTGGEGVDRVVEVCGPATIGRSLKAVRFAGEIVLIGFLSDENPGIDFFQLLESGARIRSTNVGDRETLRELVDLMDRQRIGPVIDTVFDFDRAPEAFSHLKAGRHVGKVVVKVSH